VDDMSTRLTGEVDVCIYFRRMLLEERKKLFARQTTSLANLYYWVFPFLHNTIYLNRENRGKCWPPHPVRYNNKRVRIDVLIVFEIHVDLIFKNSHHHSKQLFSFNRTLNVYILYSYESYDKYYRPWKI
jgi:hypothetical protein